MPRSSLILLIFSLLLLISQSLYLSLVLMLWVSFSLCDSLLLYLCHWLISDYISISYQVIELSPSFPEGYYHLCRSLLGMGNIDEAATVVTKVWYRRVWQSVCIALLWLLFIACLCLSIFIRNITIYIICILHFYLFMYVLYFF